MKDKKLDLSKEIMKTIKKEEIEMKPKWYFILASFLMGFSVFSLMSMATFTLNLIFFRLRMQSLMGVDIPKYLLIWHFLRFRFPWVHFLFFVLLFVIGVNLLKKYEFSYKKNWQLIVIGLLAALFMSGFLVDRAGVNEHLQKRPPLRRLYDQPSQMQDGFPGQSMPPQPAIKGVRR